jgi:hypothetical protein
MKGTWRTERVVEYENKLEYENGEKGRKNARARRVKEKNINAEVYLIK